VTYEAQLIGFKEGLKIAVVWLVLYSHLIQTDKKVFIAPFYAGLAVSLSVSALSLFLPSHFWMREYLGNIISMSFALFLILSAASLLHLSGVNLFGGRGLPAHLKKPAFINTLVFLATVVFFSPDTMGTTFFLRDLAVMKNTPFMPYLSAFMGMLIATVIIVAFTKLYKPYWIGEFFALPQLLLFLAMIKLLGSGIKGISELSLIPSVQRGFMKFIHDIVHQTFVFLMVPDHPLLKTTVWDFIAFFFGPNFASYASLLILLFFPLLFMYRSIMEPVEEPEALTNAGRRKIKSLVLSGRRKRSLPVIFFIVFIIVGWFSQTAETVSRLFVPKPKPVVMERGIVMIPLKDPTMNLRDGALHTFSLLHEGEEIRVLIIRKSDNTLSVCLDACEICPPDGYGQREDHVVCIYCSTPIHTDSLGRPGGCNPIPLVASVDENFVRIEMKEILKKWGFIKSGSGEEGRQ
jgi:hypothetical protein